MTGASDKSRGRAPWARVRPFADGRRPRSLASSPITRSRRRQSGPQDYTMDFEKTFEDDDWSRLERYRAEFDPSWV
jgi:hypothetical protein